MVVCLLNDEIYNNEIHENCFNVAKEMVKYFYITQLTLSVFTASYCYVSLLNYWVLLQNLGSTLANKLLSQQYVQFHFIIIKHRKIKIYVKHKAAQVSLVLWLPCLTSFCFDSILFYHTTHNISIFMVL
jgi:hypothetical protein